jgi:hypothetical protein
MSWHVAYAWCGIVILSWSGRGFSTTFRVGLRCHPSVQCLRGLRRPDRERNNSFPSSSEANALTCLPPARRDCMVVWLRAWKCCVAVLICSASPVCLNELLQLAGLVEAFLILL